MELVNKKTVHNSREVSQIKVIRAIKSVSWAFVSSRIFQVILFCLLISSPLYFDVLPAQSSDPRELTFGEQQTTNIFPTSAHTDDWGDVEKVLTQDPSDHALYQDFSEENSASISEHSQEMDRGESFLDTASSTDVSQEPVTEVQSSTEAVETIEATEPSSEMEESASELPRKNSSRSIFSIRHGPLGPEALDFVPRNLPSSIPPTSSRTR